MTSSTSPLVALRCPLTCFLNQHVYFQRQIHHQASEVPNAELDMGSLRRPSKLTLQASWVTEDAESGIQLQIPQVWLYTSVQYVRSTAADSGA